MTRQYGAFLLRGWQLENGEQRFEIAHIQSGASARATTLEEVIAWIGACLDPRQTSDNERNETECRAGDAARDESL